MGERVKLTEAQRETLKLLTLGGRYHISGAAAVRALKSKGLVEVNSFGVTAITSAGRAALNGHPLETEQ